MTERTPEKQAAFDSAMGMVHRHGMRIAALPKEEREEHFEIVKQSLQHAAAAVYPDMPKEREEFIDLLMRTMRALVVEIDAGSPGGKGGTA